MAENVGETAKNDVYYTESRFGCDVFTAKLFITRASVFVELYVTGLPYGLLKGQICQIWPFSKQMARQKSCLAFFLFWPFFGFFQEFNKK